MKKNKRIVFFLLCIMAFISVLSCNTTYDNNMDFVSRILLIEVNNRVLKADLVDNSSVKALVQLLEKGPTL